MKINKNTDNLKGRSMLQVKRFMALTPGTIIWPQRSYEILDKLIACSFGVIFSFLRKPDEIFVLLKIRRFFEKFRYLRYSSTSNKLVELKI